MSWREPLSDTFTCETARNKNENIKLANIKKEKNPESPKNVVRVSTEHPAEARPTLLAQGACRAREKALCFDTWSLRVKSAHAVEAKRTNAHAAQTGAPF